jgi:tetratricopeptide (TPR) repeat protein
MASNKSRVNFAFACIVAVLGLTAVREIYINHIAPGNLRGSADNLRGSADNLRGSADNLRGSADNLRGSADNRGGAGRVPAGMQLPENHPSPEAIERLMALEQKAAEDPQNADYRTQIANLYYDLGQFDKAADFYQQSLDIRPGAPGVETDLAACFNYLGQIDRALETLNRVLQHHPGFPQAMFNKGIILAHGKNDVQGAIRIWEDLLRRDPTFSQKAGLEQKINQLKASVR